MVSWRLLVWCRCWQPRATGGDPAKQAHRVRVAGSLCSTPATISGRLKLRVGTFSGVWVTYTWLYHWLGSTVGRLWSDWITASANAPRENSASSFDYYSSWSRTSFDLILNTPPSKGKWNLIWLQFKTPQSERSLITGYSCSSPSGSVLLIKSCLVFVFRTKSIFEIFGIFLQRSKSLSDLGGKSHDNKVMRSWVQSGGKSYCKFACTHFPNLTQTLVDWKLQIHCLHGLYIKIMACVCTCTKL